MSIAIYEEGQEIDRVSEMPKAYDVITNRLEVSSIRLLLQENLEQGVRWTHQGSGRSIEVLFE